MKMASNSMVAAVGIAATLTPTWVWAQQPAESGSYACGPYMMDWGAGGYGMMIFGPLFMILVLALVIALAVFLVRWLGGPWHSVQPPFQMPPRTPLDILRERYARGEIDKAEFEERRSVLGD